MPPSGMGTVLEQFIIASGNGPDQWRRSAVNKPPRPRMAIADGAGIATRRKPTCARASAGGGAYGFSA